MKRSVVGAAFRRPGVVTLLLALSLTACTLRKPYTAPVLEPSPIKGADGVAVVEQRFDPRWWGLFGDPVLDNLMSRALAANHDVRIAVARFDQARTSGPSGVQAKCIAHACFHRP